MGYVTLKMGIVKIILSGIAFNNDSLENSLLQKGEGKLVLDGRGRRGENAKTGRKRLGGRMPEETVLGVAAGGSSGVCRSRRGVSVKAGGMGSGGLRRTRLEQGLRERSRWQGVRGGSGGEAEKT